MTSQPTPQLVGVIFTRADLRQAVRMRKAPDLFELRLDALFPRNKELIAAIGKLRAPLIITARHPREGGSNQLATRERRALLLRFLPHAAYVDIELRSARTFAAILGEARAKNIRTIVSFHDFDETPSRARLEEMARSAQSLGADFLKIATRTDTPAQMARLRDFLRRPRMRTRISVMGIGRLGRISRLDFARRGSILNYAHLGSSQTEGQLSIAQLRRALAEKRK
jgi:3-dehydroquinate dehydratase I